MSLNRFKIPIIFHGKNSLKELKKIKEKRILIVTDKIVKEIHGNLLLKYLKQKDYVFFDDVEPNPKDTMIKKGSEVALEFKPDLSIGFGGGSVMDTAKMIYFLYESGKESIYECNPATSYNLGEKSKLFLIPTTSGTGAEHTPAAVISNSNTGQKVAIASEEIIPKAVFLDPKLPIMMPTQLTISSGLDALAHAIEGLTSSMSSDFTDAMNLHAIKLITQYLPNLLKESENDIFLREKLHNAASIAGIGIANSSCCLAHSCGHALGTVHDLQHGIAVGIMLPYTLEFNKAECNEKYREILKDINILKSGEPALVLANYLRDFLRKMDVPISFNKIIKSENEWNQKLEELVKFASKDILTPLNPRIITENEFKKIFEYAYSGKSIDF